MDYRRGRNDYSNPIVIGDPPSSPFQFIRPNPMIPFTSSFQHPMTNSNPFHFMASPPMQPVSGLSAIDPPGPPPTPASESESVDSDLEVACQAAESVSVFVDALRRNPSHFDLLFSSDTHIADPQNTLTQLQINRFQNLAQLLRHIKSDLMTAYTALCQSEVHLMEVSNRKEQLEAWSKQVTQFEGVGPFDKCLVDTIYGATQSTAFKSQLEQARAHKEYAVANFEAFRMFVNEMRTVSNTPACPICMNQVCNTVIIPCGHCLCEHCFSKSKGTQRCFLCRQHVSNINRIFLL